MSVYIWQKGRIFGTEELLAAAGSVIATWNYCEAIIGAMLPQFIFPSAIGKAVFHNSHNALRLELLREAGKLRGDPLDDLLAEFATQAAICIENRNLVAHAVYLPDFEVVGKYALQKAPKGRPDKINAFPIDSETMLEIADGCYRLGQFRLGIVSWHASRPGGPIEMFAELTALPDKPPRPRKLNPRPPKDQDNAPGQPLS
ncbi:MAG: hypothetical protein ACR2KH_03970 [Sphingomicrobium sp.]